jgi:hypothetical protein
MSTERSGLDEQGVRKKELSEIPSTANGSFEIQAWEQTYQQLAGDGKLTSASVKQAFSGDIEGSGSVEWLMCYRDEGQARFVGLQHFEGRLGDHSGTFVMEAVGTFDVSGISESEDSTCMNIDSETSTERAT